MKRIQTRYIIPGLFLIVMVAIISAASYNHALPTTPSTAEASQSNGPLTSNDIAARQVITGPLSPEWVGKYIRFRFHKPNIEWGTIQGPLPFTIEVEAALPGYSPGDYEPIYCTMVSWEWDDGTRDERECPQIDGSRNDVPTLATHTYTRSGIYYPYVWAKL